MVLILRSSKLSTLMYDDGDILYASSIIWLLRIFWQAQEITDFNIKIQKRLRFIHILELIVFTGMITMIIAHYFAGKVSNMSFLL